VSVQGTSAFGVCWSLGLYKPDGSLLTNTFGCGNTIFIDTQTLPVSGDYSILVDPTGAVTGQATVNLYDVVDITGTLNFGGPTVNITTTTPGQNARLTFVGSAGQLASVNATSTFSTCWNLGIFKADGTQLTNTFTCGSGIMIEPQTLPEAGTYTVVVDPSGAGIGGASVTLYDVTDVTGSITVNGPSVNVNLNTPGQNARLTFDGTAGQRTWEFTNRTVLNSRTCLLAAPTLSSSRKHSQSPEPTLSSPILQERELVQPRSISTKSLM
jgi:hypothetical protein